MKSIKKLLALAIIATLVLGLMPVAFAAAPSDVAGTKYEKAVNLLLDLGITTGYPDGTFKPENIVTRAEMAAFIVRALGLEEAAKFSAGASQFKDVKPGDWFAGYINVAATVGVIKGYPDGTFKPNATVTYPEAVTMLVRALGYTDADVVGAWPVNYIVKASQLGVSKDVTIKNEGAVRGDIALLVNNTLMADVKKADKDEPTKKLIEKGLNVVKKTFVIANIPDFDSALKEGEFRSDETNNNVYKAGNVNVKALLGMKVEAYVKDGVLIAAIPTGNTVITPKDVVDINTTDKSITYKDDADVTKTVYGTVYTFIVFNFDKLTSWDIRLDDSYVTMIDNNGDDKIDYIFAKKYAPAAKVTYVDLKNSKLYAGATYDLNDKKVTIYRNGKLATLADIQEGDVIHIAKNSDNKIFEIIAVNNVIQGKVTEIDGNYIYVNGTKYDKGGASFIVGKEYRIVLDKDNKVFEAKEITATADKSGVVTAKTAVTDEWGKITKKIKLYTAEDATVTLTVTDDVYTSAGLNTLPAFVKYTTDKDGVVNSIVYTPDDVLSAVYLAKDKITGKDNADATKTYYVKDTTVVYYVYSGDNSVKVVKYTDLRKSDTIALDQAKVFGKNAFNEIDVLVLINDEPFSNVKAVTGEITMLVTKITDVEDGKKIYGFVDGVEKAYIASTLPGGVAIDDVITFATDSEGKAVNITEPSLISGEVKAKDATRINVNGTVYKLAANVVAYKKVESKWTVASIYDITAHETDTNISTNISILTNSDGEVYLIIINE